MQAPQDSSESEVNSETTAEAQLLELQEEISAFQESQGKLAEEVLQLMSERAALREELEVLVARVQEINQQATDQEYLTQFAQQLREARGARIIAERAAAELKLEILQLNREVQELKEGSRRETAGFEEALSRARKSISEHQYVISALKDEKQESCKKLEVLSEKFESLAGAAENLRADLKAREREIGSLQENLRERDGLLKDKEGELAAASKATCNLTAQLRVLTQSIKLSKARSQEATRSAAAGRSEIGSALSKVKKSLCGEIDQSKARHNRLQEALKRVAFDYVVRDAASDAPNSNYLPADSRIESASIEHGRSRLSVQCSIAKPQRVLIVFETYDQGLEKKGITLAVEAQEYARALPPREIERHGGKAQYLLHRYFSEIISNPSELEGIEDVFISTLLRILNQDTSVTMGLNSMHFDYWAERDLTVPEKYRYEVVLPMQRADLLQQATGP